MGDSTNTHTNSRSDGAQPPAASSETPGQPLALTPDVLQAIARAIADPSRFAILQQIATAESMMCSDLDAQNSLSPATISHHLRELQEAGLVHSRRDGRRMCLQLRRPVWNAFVRSLQQL